MAEEFARVIDAQNSERSLDDFFGREVLVYKDEDRPKAVLNV